MNPDEVIEQAAQRLEGRGSHTPFESAVEGMPFSHLGTSVDGVPYTVWQLVEHIRLAQHDILEYTLDPTHESPPWPEGYWSENPAPVSEDAWRASVAQILSDRDALISLLPDDPTRLLEGTEHSVLREALIAATHLSYHTGEIVLLRRVLDCWD